MDELDLSQKDVLPSPETRPVIPPGELWVFPHNLKTIPLPHDLELHPYAKYPVNVPIPKELLPYFRATDITSEVSTRSTLAQSKLITSYEHDGNGNLKYIFENNGVAKFTAQKGHEIEVGVPFFHSTPLDFEKTDDIRSHIITEGEVIETKHAGEIEGIETVVIMIPIETEHPQTWIPDDIKLENLPGGPQRQRLHLLNGVDTNGIKNGQDHNGFETHVKLGATARLVLPQNTALRIVCGYDARTGQRVPHLDSDLLLSNDLKEGKPVTHTIITETEGQVPTHVLCEVYISKRMDAPLAK